MSIDGTAPTTRVVQAARTGLTSRAKWAFTAFVAALIGLGLTPQATQLTTQSTPDRHRTDTVRSGADQAVQRGTQAKPQPATMPQTREGHGPFGPGDAVVPAEARPGFPDAGQARVTQRSDRFSRSDVTELPEVRGPPTTSDR